MTLAVGHTSADLVEETVALRRVAAYRSAFKDTALSYPGTLVRYAAVSDWMRRHKACITVSDLSEINVGVMEGISPQRMTMHLAGARAPRTAAAGVAQYIVSRRDHIPGVSDHPSRVLVALNADAADLAAEILSRPHLELVGVQCQVSAAADPFGILAIRSAVQEMADIRRRHGALPSRIWIRGLAPGDRGRVPRVLRHVAEALYEASGEACEHHRYPRPQLVVEPAVSEFLH